MLLDARHKPWIAAVGGGTLASAAVYIPYHLLSLNGPSGGSGVGLAFGLAAFGLMAFAGLLGLRRRFPALRVGRPETWMRGHLWLGLLSYPLILFHAGFSLGNSGFTRALMWIFSLIVITGVLGAAMQHYMPRIMTDRVPMETIYSQIDRVQKELVQEADGLLGSLSEKKSEYGLLVPSSGMTGLFTSTSAGTTLVRLSERAARQSREMYEQTIRPYLAQRGAYRHILNDRRTSKALFTQLRTLTPESARPMIDDLENICEEKRDLDRQSRLHRILYSWLLVHVPLSFLLIILGAIHAVMALRYS